MAKIASNVIVEKVWSQILFPEKGIWISGKRNLAMTIFIKKDIFESMLEKSQSVRPVKRQNLEYYMLFARVDVEELSKQFCQKQLCSNRQFPKNSVLTVGERWTQMLWKNICSVISHLLTNWLTDSENHRNDEMFETSLAEISKSSYLF